MKTKLEKGKHTKTKKESNIQSNVCVFFCQQREKVWSSKPYYLVLKKKISSVLCIFAKSQVQV